MKCPKCHYLSFEPEARCRNCGYDLSVPDADLSLRLDQADDEPMVDLALHAFEDEAMAGVISSPGPALAVQSAERPPHEESMASAPRRRRARAPRPRVAAADRPRAGAAAERTATATATPPAESWWLPEEPPTRQAPSTTELPLFVKGLPAEATEPTENEQVLTVEQALDSPPEALLEPEAAPPVEAARTAAAEEPDVAEAVDEIDEIQEQEALTAVGPAVEVRPAGELEPAVVHEAARKVEEPEDEPLEKLYRDLRPPLAVRRPTPEAGRVKAKYSQAPARRLGPFDRDLLEDLQRMEKDERSGAEVQAGSSQPMSDQADAAARLAAAAVDALFIGGLGVGIFWATLRWCGLSFDRASVLPVAPFVAFLLIVGAGYLLMFTAAGGQTIGKMWLGLRVVDESETSRASLSGRQVFFRELLTLPSVLALGAGFLPALVGEGRALHDRLAHTRVVRA